MLFESGAIAIVRYQLGACGERCELYQPIVLLRPERITLEDDVRLDGFVKVEGGQGVRLCRYVHVASFAHLNIGGGTLVMEEGSAVASGGKIVTGSSQLAGASMSAKAPPEQQRVARGLVVVGRNAVILTNAVVLPNVTIGARAVIGAGAVVRCDVPEGEVWAGNPARKIGVRVVGGDDGC